MMICPVQQKMKLAIIPLSQTSQITNRLTTICRDEPFGSGNDFDPSDSSFRVLMASTT